MAKEVSRHKWYREGEAGTGRGHKNNADSKGHEAYMGPTWGRQDPGVPHVGPMIIAIRERGLRFVPDTCIKWPTLDKNIQIWSHMPSWI